MDICERPRTYLRRKQCQRRTLLRRITQLSSQVAYQRILQLTYVDELLSALKTLFVKLFEPFLATFLASLHAVNSGKAGAESAVSWNFAKAFDNWDNIFDKLLAGLEGKAAQVCHSVCFFCLFYHSFNSQ